MVKNSTFAMVPSSINFFEPWEAYNTILFLRSDFTVMGYTFDKDFGLATKETVDQPNRDGKYGSYYFIHPPSFQEFCGTWTCLGIVLSSVGENYLFYFSRQWFNQQQILKPRYDDLAARKNQDGHARQFIHSQDSSRKLLRFVYHLCI